MKKIKKLRISKDHSIDRWGFDNDLAGVLVFVQELIETYGADAVLDWDIEHGYYNDVSIELTLTEYRDESDDEFDKRMAKNKKAAAKTRATNKENKAKQEITDRLEFERLTKLFAK